MSYNRKHFELVMSSYSEMGSVEGYIKSFDPGGTEKPISFIIITRLDDRHVTCVCHDGLKVNGVFVTDISKNTRVLVYGRLHYVRCESSFVLDDVFVDCVELFPPQEELPCVDDLIDPDFTGGADSVEFIRGSRS